MSDPERCDDTRSQVDILLQIEQLCTEFEAGWNSGGRPRIEDFLARGPAARQEQLLRGLLEIELEMRTRAGQRPGLDEYCQRFPQHASQVESVFRSVLQCKRLGDYELLEQLGHGGMGEVYRARHVYLNQIVAVKILPERYLDEPQAIARFRREMLSIGALDHANIVRAQDAGEADGVHFLVLEYVDGVNLQRLVADRIARGAGPLGIGAACEAIRQAALALQHAHEHGLVHRDVKPANLMLTRSGVVKLLDLGLAKFRTDWQRVDPREGPLTQDGVTMGTIDYIAPEQWEDPSGVDIRADIYSLGCTLFFLLTGQPPYGGEMYESGRKKLMAHVVAPIPSLRERVPNCPDELDHILARMMAKNPNERFDTPSAVADAVGSLASAEELAACAATQDEEAGLQPDIASSPSVKNAHAETARKFARANEPPKRPAAQPGSAATRRRRLVRLTAAAVGLALAAGWTLWALLRVGPDTAKPNGDRARHHAELLLLPGLNGQWWCDEMPWYTPFARRAVAEALESEGDASLVLGDNPSAYLDPNTAAVQGWLWEIVARCRSRLPKYQLDLLDELKQLADASLDDAELAKRLAASLERFVQACPGEPTAEDLHMVALLRHKIASSEGSPTLAQQAKQAYDSALDAYAGFRGTAAQLRLLCLTDAACLCSRVLTDFPQARIRFDEALSAPRLPALFRVVTLASYGEAAAAAADYQDGLFHEARRVLESSELGTRSHPLAAHIRERYAWSLMDQWKVDEARRQFQEAGNIRWTNQRESQNPFAAIYVFHNRHGQAITFRYQGKAEAARGQFAALVGDEPRVGDLKAAWKESSRPSPRPGQQRYHRDLSERLANSMERWADCELYGGAASGAPVNLARARQLYHLARSLSGELATRVVMACKYCIIAALQGKVEDARKVFNDPEISNRKMAGRDSKRAELMRQVADAVLALKEKGIPEGQKRLRAFLDRCRLVNTNPENTRRETLELQLFAAELLLGTDLKANDLEAASRDLRYLDDLLTAFRGRRDMLPFLRRYYSLAIRATGKSDLVQLCQYILASRAAQPRDRLLSEGVTLLVFYFASEDNHAPAAENFAILLPPGGPGTFFPLNLTRQQIKEAASLGQALRLDEKLVQLVRAESQAGRTIEVSWCDTMCFANEDEGLGQDDWPFGEQLTLPSLHRQ